MKKDKEYNKDEDLLECIRDNFKSAEEYYNDGRVQAQEDFRFRAGDQWDADIRTSRAVDKRPCLTINKLQQFVRQVVNNQKINRPSINVKAVDSNADIETAKIYEAIIKNIEDQSMAENAYDTAFDNACTGGEGYFRIVTDYLDPLSFDQEIYIKPIDNSFAVYIDPNFKSDFSEMQWAFVFDTIKKDEFARLYPDSECVSNSWIGYGMESGWLASDEVRIAEYFYIEWKEVDIVLLSTGQVIKKSDWNDLDDKGNVTVLKERKTQMKSTKWCKTNGYEILEETDFPSMYIPIIPVFADTYILDGKRVTEGVIRQAKEAQRSYNLWVSAEAEIIALSPKAPWIGAAGQFEGFENSWRLSNTKSQPYLQYNATSASGQVMPPPQRAVFDPNIQTIVGAKAASNDDLKATTGIYDPSLGKEQKEASGIALMTKQRQAEVTSFMYIDNLSKSLKYAGRILLDMIPKIYDTKRIVRIMGKTNQPDELVTINSNAESDIILGIGKYDVSITIGPYGENQRQQAIESMLSLMQINPEIAGLIGDIFVAKQDWDGASEIAERLKIMLPPALQKDNKELPPEIAAKLAQAQQQYEAQIQQDQLQMQQMQQLISNLTSELNKVTSQYENKTAEIESKERIEAMKARVQLTIAGLKEDANDSRLAFEQELNYTNQKQLGNTEIPLQGDTTVLPGVNDPITEAKGEESGELTQEEQEKLLSDLDQYTQASQIQ